MAVDTSTTPDKPKPPTHVPRGMVMGPDGKPCKICTAFRNWKPGSTNYTEPDSNRDRVPSVKTTSGSVSPPRQRQKAPEAQSFPGLAGVIAAGASTSSKEREEAARPDEPPPGCPPDSEQLGRATWTFLHTTAAYYPDKPSPMQRANMLMLLRSLPVLYPCSWCAEDFGEDIENNPPNVSSRMALSRWLCERHNAVNEKLGKEKFDCMKVDERWKDGPPDGSCD